MTFNIFIAMVLGMGMGALATLLFLFGKMSQERNMLEFIAGLWESNSEVFDKMLMRKRMIVVPIHQWDHLTQLAKYDTHYVNLPGWLCPRCDVFNGEGKSLRTECRSCELEFLRYPADGGTSSDFGGTVSQEGKEERAS